MIPVIMLALRYDDSLIRRWLNSRVQVVDLAVWSRIMVSPI